MESCSESAEDGSLFDLNKFTPAFCECDFNRKYSVCLDLRGPAAAFRRASKDIHNQGKCSVLLRTCIPELEF